MLVKGLGCRSFIKACENSWSDISITNLPFQPPALDLPVSTSFLCYLRAKEEFTGFRFGVYLFLSRFLNPCSRLLVYTELEASEFRCVWLQ